MKGALIDFFGAGAGGKEDECSAGDGRGELRTEGDAEKQVLRLLSDGNCREEQGKQAKENNSQRAHGAKLYGAANWKSNKKKRGRAVARRARLNATLTGRAKENEPGGSPIQARRAMREFDRKRKQSQG